MENQGCSVAVSTVPVFRRPNFLVNLFVSHLFNERGVNFHVSPIFGFPIIDRIWAALLFFLKACSVEKDGIVFFYNFFPEYIPAAIVRRIFFRPAILDVEDAPRDDEPGVRGWVNRISYSVLRRVCFEDIVSVSRRNLLHLKSENGLVVYGGVDKSAILKPRIVENVIRISFGGALLRETGIYIFRDAIHELLKRSAEIAIPVEFHVTGFDMANAMDELVSNMSNNDRISIFWKGDVPLDEYESILGSCHIGLCLKIPGMSMGDTTFPSKVVEITSYGLALMSTPVSDVPILFDEKSAFMLGDDYAADLVERIIFCSKNPSLIFNVASAGVEVCKSNFTSDIVGKRFVKLFKTVGAGNAY